MTLIHTLTVADELRQEIDPVRGLVAHTEKTIRAGSATSISHDGETYKADAGGTFDVPADLATFLLRQPDWHQGENPFRPAPKTPAKRK